MRYLGIDYGAKRVGIAISDKEGKIAFPHLVIPNKDLISQISSIVKEKGIERVVLGDTRTVSGKENPITAEAEKFAKELSDCLKMPIEKIFESWSSMETLMHSSSGLKDDSRAAAFILQRYLDINGSKKDQDPKSSRSV